MHGFGSCSFSAAVFPPLYAFQIPFHIAGGRHGKYPSKEPVPKSGKVDASSCARHRLPVAQLSSECDMQSCVCDVVSREQLYIAVWDANYLHWLSLYRSIADMLLKPSARRVFWGRAPSRYQTPSSVTIPGCMPFGPGHHFSYL